MTAAIPSILKLHGDIFLHICHLNTYMPESEYSIQEERQDLLPLRPINVARYTSQVCRAWRQILLGSPAIWASLLDMTCFNRPGSEIWAEEVLNRSGECDLSIYGRLQFGYMSQKFFTSLIFNWHRVRRLDIVIDRPWAIGSSVWDMLAGRPAPRLEKFILMDELDLFDATPIPPKPKVLFADFAPLLQRFHCTALRPAHGTTWLSQLSSFTLLSPPSEVLSILSATVRLESLVIKNRDSMMLDGDLTKISLPHLIRLDIRGTVSQCLLYLRNIVPHSDCALILEVIYDAEFISVEQLNRLIDIVKLYTVRYFNIQKPPRLLICCKYSSFQFQTINNTNMMYFAHPELNLTYSIQRRNDPPSTFLLNLPMSSLSSIPLGCIVELEYKGARGGYGIQPHDIPALLKLLENLTLVRTLIISLNTIRILCIILQLTESSTLALPSLTDVQVRCEAGSKTINDLVDSSMLVFFYNRKEAGAPIQTLDLSYLPISWSRHNWSFLDEIEGLKVVWKDSEEFEYEYLCGSGGKEILDWGNEE